MNAHVRHTPSLEDPSSYNPYHLTVAIESFQGIRHGDFPSFMYDVSIPKYNYIGGGEKWAHFRETSTNYLFPQSNTRLLKESKHEIADKINKHTNGRLEGLPWHLIDLTPGTAFGTHDIQLVKAMHSMIEDRGEELIHLGIDEINKDFREASVGIAQEKLNLKRNQITGSSRDILRSSITTSNSKALTAIDRRTVVLWADGTIGNVGYKGDILGFPDDQLIHALHKQVDYTARECYVVVFHNSFANKNVLDFYQGEEHAQFALGSMHGIKQHLPTRDFDPDAYTYRNSYDEEHDVVKHESFSACNQESFIGKAGFILGKNEFAASIGNSVQISNDRMGNLSTKGGFTRVAEFESTMEGYTTATILKATPELMDALKENRIYKPSFF